MNLALNRGGVEKHRVRLIGRNYRLLWRTNEIYFEKFYRGILEFLQKSLVIPVSPGPSIHS